VTDALSGQPMNGTVMVNANTPNAASGATNQPITYRSCGPFGAAFTSPPPPPLPCAGSVHVPYYPDVRFLDVPDPGVTLSNPIQPVMRAKP
jgi:hypothetical protein